MKLLESLIDKDRGGCGFISRFSHDAIRMVSCEQTLSKIRTRQNDETQTSLKLLIKKMNWNWNLIESLHENAT